MITLALSGADAITARYQSFAARAQARLSGVMARLGVALLDQARANLAGGKLQARSGRLAAAQEMQLRDDGTRQSVSVGFDTAAAPYGAIQEFGGTTRAHLIEAKNAFALRFSLHGQLVFAKRVQHPGSVIPAHSFLRDALAALSDAGAAETIAAIGAEVGP